MSAYVIVDINVADPAGYEEYKRLAAPTVTAYGGKYIAGRTDGNLRGHLETNPAGYSRVRIPGAGPAVASLA